VLEARSTPENRRTARALLIACTAFALAAALIGLSDNPFGLALAYLAATAVVLAVVHPCWSARSSMRRPSLRHPPSSFW
jgi:heme A synthase